MRHKEAIRAAYQDLVNVTISKIKTAVNNKDLETAQDLVPVANLIMFELVRGLYMEDVISEEQKEALQNQLCAMEHRVFDLEIELGQ